ncbi:sulfatase [Nocardioides sp. 503]|uniref:sulfatase family protein n=1 Tax=Nocardioides sp. 503 TaxID=2508326 RepID=UPI00106FC72E|nr:sulfatase [Nocardioides sp. 503]
MTSSTARRLAVCVTVCAALVVALLVWRSVHAEPSDADFPQTTGHGAAFDGATGPNVVVVMADDMRADDLMFMPSMGELVGDHGLTFQNSFSPYPLCCPARTSFLTGRYAHNHHVYWHEEPYGYGAFDDSKTIATSLQAAGYETGYIGKYLNRYGPAKSKVSGGPSYKYVPEGWTDWRASIDRVEGVGVHGSTYDYMDTPFNVNGKVDNRYKGDYNTDVIGDFSVEMAQRFAKQDNPFFMMVNYVAPHSGGPIEDDDPASYLDVGTPAVPKSVRGRFDDLITRGSGMPKDGGPSEADISDKPRAFSEDPEPDAQLREAIAESTRQRAEAISVMDGQVERLIKELKRSGEWDDTVFMFTSDNGFYLGEHRRRGGKVRAHEPSLRVPFVVTGPGMREKADRNDPITTIDISASILDLADAEPPYAADGTSRLTTMRRGDQGWVTPVVNEATNTGRLGPRPRGFSGPRTSIGIRTARYSYIRSATSEDELYDLQRDPLEMENVDDAPAYAAVRRSLLKVWWKTRNCVGAECQVPLPPALRADPATEAALTTTYWDSIREAYGFE